MTTNQSNNLRPCPFCGNKPVVEGNLVACNNLNCPTHDNYWTDPMIFTCDQWNTRPIEDALNARISELKAFIDQLIELGDVINGDKDSVWTLRTVKEHWTIEVAKWKERE